MSKNVGNNIVREVTAST